MSARGVDVHVTATEKILGWTLQMIVTIAQMAMLRMTIHELRMTIHELRMF